MIKFTGIVVVYNEDSMLKKSLKSLSFCEDIIVVDLGSEDQSVDIARECNARIVFHDHVPTAPEARKFGAKHALTDWIVFLDPDEVFPSHIYDCLCATIEKNPKVGQVKVPWKFFFKEEPLEGTRWGGEKYKGHVLSRSRCWIGPPQNKYAHKDVSLKPGYEYVKLPWKKENAIKHYWFDSFYSLYEKHARYVQNEGEVRYERGERFPGWMRWFLKIISAFKGCYVHHDGWREGARGLFLSAFWSWYQGASLLSLRKYQRKAD